MSNGRAVRANIGIVRRCFEGARGARGRFSSWYALPGFLISTIEDQIETAGDVDVGEGVEEIVGLLGDRDSSGEPEDPHQLEMP